MDVMEKATGNSKASLPLVLGEREARLEQAALTLGTSRVYRFRRNHPRWYALIAFVLGGGFTTLFTMSTYTNWVYQSIDLQAAVDQIVLGGLGGGIVMVIAAFAYAATLRPTLAPMQEGGVTRP
jgi:hypothetical protein